MIVMEGLSLPSLLKSGTFSILAKGLLGLGSLGVPSTLVQLPILVFIPMTVCLRRLCSPMLDWARMIESEIRVPAPITTFLPIDTFGPS